MSKTLRRQLADAHQEIRDLKNAQHVSAQPLLTRIAELEAQNRRLALRLRETSREIFAVKVLARNIQQVCDATDICIDAALATGKPDRLSFVETSTKPDDGTKLSWEDSPLLGFHSIRSNRSKAP